MEITGMGKHGGYEDEPIVAEFYDLYATRSDIGFYLDYCRAAKGKILELGCGTGRILIPAADSDCQITGLDLSQHMLAKCGEKLKQKSADVQNRVRLIKDSMTDFNLNEKFRLTIIPFHAFQHLISVDDQLSCLECIHRHLEKDGKLIFDVFHVNFDKIDSPRNKEEVEADPEFELADGRRFRRTYRITAFNRAEQYNNVEIFHYLTDTDGTTIRLVQAFPFRYFFRYEVEHLLVRCGFNLVESFGDFSKAPIGDDSPEMIFVAKKRQAD
jgi:SAM-dependent methyltransferase